MGRPKGSKNKKRGRPAKVVIARGRKAKKSGGDDLQAQLASLAIEVVKHSNRIAELEKRAAGCTKVAAPEFIPTPDEAPAFEEGTEDAGQPMEHQEDSNGLVGALGAL